MRGDSKQAFPARTVQLAQTHKISNEHPVVTNWKQYVTVKTAKLAEQFEVGAHELSKDAPAQCPQLFKGVTVWVNGYTRFLLFDDNNKKATLSRQLHR